MLYLWLYRVKGDLFGLAATVAFMGAPSDAKEKSISGQELTQCLHVTQNIIASGKELEYKNYFVVHVTITTILTPKICT